MPILTWMLLVVFQNPGHVMFVHLPGYPSYEHCMRAREAVRAHLPHATAICLEDPR